MQSPLETRIRSGAVWFYWTAVLAIVATVLRSSGQAWASLLGLGVMQSPYAARFASGEKITVLVAAVIVLCALGWFAGLGKMSAFVAGMLAYAADGVLLAMSAQWFGVGVHAVILIFMYGGLTAAGMAIENDRLTRDLAIRAALAKDRASRPAIPETPLKPESSDPVSAPQAFRPGAAPSPPEGEE
jgi:hypothetical protein